jgi:hypothetical protein
LPAELGGAGIFKSARLISFAVAEDTTDGILVGCICKLGIFIHNIAFFHSRFDAVAALGSDRGPCGLGLPHATRNVWPLMIHPVSEVLSAAFSAPTLVA